MLVFQDFEFRPSELFIEMNALVTIKVGRNRSQSRIYDDTERFYIFNICGEQIDEESPPLYENDTFEYTFNISGSFNVACSNYAKGRCTVYVATSKVWEPIETPKPLPPKAQKRPFDIKPEELVVQNTEIQPQQSDDESQYLEQLYKSEKVRKNPPQELVRRYEARSEQRFRVEEEDEDDNDDYMSCFNEFSMQASKKRSKQARQVLALSNADSLSTYYTVHQHFNKIETDSTFSEMCDQMTFTRNDAPEQKVGRKNSDPLIQNVKEDLIKVRYHQHEKRYVAPIEVTVEDSSDKQKSSDSDKEYSVTQKYFITSNLKVLQRPHDKSLVEEQPIHNHTKFIGVLRKVVPINVLLGARQQVLQMQDFRIAMDFENDV